MPQVFSQLGRKQDGKDSSDDTCGESIQSILEKELHALSKRLNYPLKLNVIWAPETNSGLEGEVKQETIWIYSRELSKAIATLRHEVLDWIVAEAVKPYLEIANLHRVVLNASFKYLQDEAYSRKEHAIELLEKLIGESNYE